MSGRRSLGNKSAEDFPLKCIAASALRTSATVVTFPSGETRDNRPDMHRNQPLAAAIASHTRAMSASVKRLADGR